MSKIALLKDDFLACLGPVLAHAAGGGAEWLIRFDKTLTAEDAKRISATGQMPEGSVCFNLREKDGYVNLGRLVNSFTPGTDAAVAFCAIESDRDTDQMIGIGCDWWFTGYINGEFIGTTEPEGNEDGLITPYLHRYQVRLKKGLNPVAIHLRPGCASWGFAFALLPDFSEWPQAQTDRKMLFNLAFPDKVERACTGGPSVSKVSTDSAVITTAFSLPSAAGVRIWENGTDKAQARELWTSRYGLKENHRLHRFEFTGLKPETAYAYEALFLNEETAEVCSAGTGIFTTFPVTGNHHSFSVFGDTQVINEARVHFLTDCLNNDLLNGAFCVSLGDMASEFSDFNTAYFTSSLNLLKYPALRIPFVPVRGNHEFRGRETAYYGRAFGSPYFSFTYGDTVYIVLDTGEDKPVMNIPNHYTLRNDFGGYFREQADWLHELAKTDVFKNAKHRIVLAHCTPFETIDRFMAPNIKSCSNDLFFGKDAPFKPDLWICGHTHVPFRYDPVCRKLTHLTANPEKKYNLSEKDMDVVDFPVIVNDGAFETIRRLSVLQVDVEPDVIRARMLRCDGTVFDAVEIRKGQLIRVIQNETAK